MPSEDRTAQPPLRACPWCGQQPRLVQNAAEAFYVKCQCGVTMQNPKAAAFNWLRGWNSAAEASAAWNRTGTAAVSPPQSQLEAAQKREAAMREALTKARELLVSIYRNYDCDRGLNGGHATHCRCCDANEAAKKIAKFLLTEGAK